jgi:AAA ATPase domain
MRPHRTSSDAGISSWPARRSRPREGRLPGSASAKSCEPESADGVQWVVSYDVRVSDGAPEALGGRPDLVGRDVEEGRIAAFLASVPRGVRALVFRGEPGIGKTALWRRALEESRTAGHHVLVARPAEEEMSLALGALLDLFEHVPLDPAALQADENPLARGRMVLEALRQLAETRPVVVAIDDLQWIDSASARVLRFALRRLDAEPVGLLATVRVGADSEDPLAAAAILPPERYEARDVAPLDLDAVRHVLHGAVTSISHPILRRIHEASGGNPLFAIELARALESGGRPNRPAGGLRLPDSLHAAIAGRLERVPTELWPLLETASGLGPTSVKELREVTAEAVDGSSPSECLVKALQRGL